MAGDDDGKKQKDRGVKSSSEKCRKISNKANSNNIREVLKKKKVLPEELSAGWTDLDQSAGQAFSFHHGRRRCQFVSLDQSTGDPGGRRALSGRDDDAHAVVTTSSHGAAPGVDHEADQEPDGEGKKRKNEEERRKKRQRVIGDRETVKQRQVRGKEVTREGKDKKRNGKKK